MASVAERRYIEELSLLLQKNIKVTTSSGKIYSGILSGVNSQNFNVCLSKVKDSSGSEIFKLFIPGRVIEQIESVEKPFDLKGLADRFERLFPRMVKLYEDAGVIVVMDKIRVTEQGIIEGSGPAAERVQRVYEEFMREKGQQ